MEDLLGVLGLIVYIALILSLSAGITYAVIRISPSQSAKQQTEKTP